MSKNCKTKIIKNSKMGEETCQDWGRDERKLQIKHPKQKDKESKWINFLCTEVQRWGRMRGECVQIDVAEHIYQSFQNPVVENQMPRPFGKQLRERVTNYLDVPVYLSSNSCCYGPCQLACLTSTAKVGTTYAYCNRFFIFLFSYLLQNSYVCISEKHYAP